MKLVEDGTKPSAGATAPVLFWDAFQLAGQHLLVGTGDETARSAVKAVLSGFGPVHAVDLLRRPRFSIVRSDESWRIAIDDKPVDSAPDFLIALSNLEWHVVDHALAQRTDLFQMHAAALALPTRRAGLVLAGVSGAGKSTLTLALMLRGFSPFSDDVTIVNPDTLELMPFPRAFHVDERTWQVLEPVAGVLLHTDPEMPAGYFCPPQWAHRPVPLRWVVFPDYQVGRQSQLSRMTRADAVAALVANSGTLHRVPRLALRTAVRIAEQVPCYRLAAGDLAQSIVLLQELVYASDST